MDIIKQAAERFLKGVDLDNTKGLSLDTIMPALQELITDSEGKLDLEQLEGYYYFDLPKKALVSPFNQHIFPFSKLILKDIPTTTLVDIKII